MSAYQTADGAGYMAPYVLVANGVGISLRLNEEMQAWYGIGIACAAAVGIHRCRLKSANGVIVNA